MSGALLDLRRVVASKDAPRDLGRAEIVEGDRPKRGVGIVKKLCRWL
jgi:hypothetical protein